MNLTTLLTTLESNLDRQTTNYKGLPTITYTGTITKVTVNTNDEYTNVYQLLLSHDDSCNVYLHINHDKNNYLTSYKLSEITSIVIT